MIEAGTVCPYQNRRRRKDMNTVHNDKPTKEAYRAAIARMVGNIEDRRVLAMIYRYILYLYTGKR